MGGGDLNMKKSWHPGLIKNRAQVWEDQHAALQERKRIEALKKEIEEERAANELQKLNEANGGAKRQERVDFLYAGPGAGSGMSEDRESYLLGRKRIDDVLGKDSMGQELGNAVAPEPEAGGLNMRDVTNKIALDPLLAIKKQEAAQYEALVNKKKAELEAEARKSARREARRKVDDDRHRSSRHGESRRSSDRHHDSDGYDRSRDTGRSSRRRRSSSRDRDYDRYRSSRHGRDRSVDRDREHRSSTRRRSPVRERSRDRRYTHRSDSRSGHRESSRRNGSTSRRSRSRSISPVPGASTHRPPASTQDQSSTTPEEETALKAAKLAEMSAAACDLDRTRDARLEEAKRRDVEAWTAEEEARAREARAGKHGYAGFVRKMQLSETSRSTSTRT